MRQSLRKAGTALCFCLALIATTSEALSLDHRRVRTLRGPAAFAVPNVTQTVPRKVVEPESSFSGRSPPASTSIGTAWHLPIAKLKASVISYWILIIMSTMIWIMMVVLVAFNYRVSESYFPEIGPAPEDPVTTRKQLSKWQFAWYQCASDLDICFWSCCCPWIRWAHTMDLLHLVEFGPALAIFLMLAMVNQLTGFVFIGVYFTMLLVYYRQKVRKVFGMQNYGTCAGIFEDWLCLCFCLPCTIAQEAQHVKFAAEMGYPLPACMAENGGRRKNTSSPELDEEDPGGTSSSFDSFQDVISKVSGSVRDSPAMPQREGPPIMVFGSLFHHSPRSRSTSRGVARERAGFPHHSRRRSRSSSRDRSQRPKTSPAPKPKALTHDRSTGSLSSAVVARGPWHREAQNPMPERLLAQAPVRAGAPGEIRPGKLNFVQVLVALHDDLRAYAFLFVEVGCVGRCGASCRTLHAYMWGDRAFWQFYCGPSVNDRLVQPWACPAHALREAFRRWIFHIDGVWTKDFREFVDQARQSPSGADLSLMLSYARYIASGLMPYDSRPAVAEFTGIMCELLAEYNPESPDERNAAEAMTAQVECMAEVFTGAQITMILSAFDCSLGRAVSAPSEPDSEPAWVIPEMAVHPVLLDDEAGEGQPWGDHDILWFG